MNAMLHDIEAPITLGDTLSNIGKSMHDYDLVLTNPPLELRKAENVLHVMILLILQVTNS